MPHEEELDALFLRCWYSDDVVEGQPLAPGVALRTSSRNEATMKPVPFNYSHAESVASGIQALVDASGDGKDPCLRAKSGARPRDAPGAPFSACGHQSNPRVGSHRASRCLFVSGALVRHADMVEQRHSPLLAEAGPWIGHPAIRSRGTVGGSISHSDPSAEWPVLASALEVAMTVAGRPGDGTVPASEFFLGALDMGVRRTLPTPWRLPSGHCRHRARRGPPC